MVRLLGFIFLIFRCVLRPSVCPSVCPYIRYYLEKTAEGCISLPARACLCLPWSHILEHCVLEKDYLEIYQSNFRITDATAAATTTSAVKLVASVVNATTANTAATAAVNATAATTAATTALWEKTRSF